MVQLKTYGSFILRIKLLLWKPVDIGQDDGPDEVKILPFE